MENLQPYSSRWGEVFQMYLRKTDVSFCIDLNKCSIAVGDFREHSCNQESSLLFHICYPRGICSLCPSRSTVPSVPSKVKVKPFTWLGSPGERCWMTTSLARGQSRTPGLTTGWRPLVLCLCDKPGHRVFLSSDQWAAELRTPYKQPVICRFPSLTQCRCMFMFLQRKTAIGLDI